LVGADLNTRPRPRSRHDDLFTNAGLDDSTRHVELFAITGHEAITHTFDHGQIEEAISGGYSA
jgi:hypothetical protein